MECQESALKAAHFVSKNTQHLAPSRKASLPSQLNMQFKSLFVLIAVPILAVALPGGQPPPKTQTTTVVVPTTITVVQPQPPAPTAPSGVSQCNTGSTQCCNSVQSASSSTINLLTGLLGIVLGPVTGNVGVTCSPLSVVGVGGNSWLVLDFLTI